jgi:hypothetical protein
MKKALIIFGLCCLLNTSIIICQVTTNKYEVEMDKGLAKKNLEYYNGLKSILAEFQEHLISQRIIENNDYQSYVGLLKQLGSNSKKEFDITYNLKDSIEKLGQRYNSEALSAESFFSGTSHLDFRESKNFLFHQKMSELFAKKEDLNHSTLANVILQVYDEKDFELPLIKLKIFRFLDPNSDGIMYIYVGRPNPE